MQGSKLKKFSVELISTPAVPDNVRNFQVFDDDRHILTFLASSDVFERQISDESNKDQGDWNPKDCDTEGVLNLKNNSIPKGMVALERIFDSDPRAREKISAEDKGGEYETINLADSGPKRNVYVGKAYLEAIRKDILMALKKDIATIAWGYEDLKTFDATIVTHTIPLKPEAKPFRQKQRPVNALIEPLIFKEGQKLLSARIIFLVHHSTWVANLVPVRKKNEEIRLCVDFRNLNRASEKDNY